ncbi:MAG: VWA domain-containing protein, partial [Anaerolineales bacterium]
TFTPPPLKEPKADSAQQNGSRPVEPDEPPIVQATLTYSEREVLRHKDFSELTAEELQEIQQLMSGLVWQLGMRPARRMRSGQGAQFDMRRTIRNSLRFGGEILLWERRQRKVKPRPLVIIADISGSMERYTRLLLHFIYSLSEGLHQKVEAFVFSTRLTRITRQLRERDVDQALMLVSRQVPLLGSDEYEPLTRGMQAALPFVDDFLPVHNLASLEDLAEHLSHIDDHRPFRRQMA